MVERIGPGAVEGRCRSDDLPDALEDRDVTFAVTLLTCRAGQKRRSASSAGPSTDYVAASFSFFSARVLILVDASLAANMRSTPAGDFVAGTFAGAAAFFEAETGVVLH